MGLLLLGIIGGALWCAGCWILWRSQIQQGDHRERMAEIAIARERQAAEIERDRADRASRTRSGLASVDGSTVTAAPAPDSAPESVEDETAALTSAPEWPTEEEDQVTGDAEQRLSPAL